MNSYIHNPECGPPGVEAVIKSAKVSRATFYKYFSSVEQALSTVGNDLIEEMVLSFRQIYSDDDGPYFRIIVGIQIFLMRSVLDPLWAAFVSRSDYQARDTELLRGITIHLALARQQGFVEFDDVAVATSLVVGTLMGAIRHLTRSDLRSRAYVSEVTIMILRGLGVERDVARQAVYKGAQFIAEQAPSRLGWWQDPWDRIG